MKNLTYYKIVLLLSLAIFITPLVVSAAPTAITNPASNFFIEFSDNSFGAIISMVIKALLAIAGGLSILFLILGGIQYITSGVNEKLAATSKKTITNAIIGLVIVILSYAVLRLIENLLRTGTP
jgi:hypothetical protein